MTGRIYSIDAMRIIAIVFVVVIHTDPFQGVSTYGNMINFGTKTISRFAVPFFFITSGYFFAIKTADRNPATYLKQRAGKLTSLYLFGLLLAAPIFLAGRLARAELTDESVWTTAISSAREFLNPAELLYYGTSVSDILWFLPALFFSLLFVSLVDEVGTPSYVLPVALGFHLIGLLGSTYTMFVDIPFETRDALFFGFFYTSLGYTIRVRDWVPTEKTSRPLVGLIGLFIAVQFVEFYLLGYPLRGEAFGSYVYAPSYGVSTALLSTALFLYLLSRPTLFAETPVPNWGIYAVGIYVTHPTTFAILESIREALETMGYPIDSLVSWHLFLTPATIAGALGLYVLAHRIGLIEIGGSHLPGAPWLRARRSDTK
ncbi:acyltransferase family protein [Halalkalirubrum salinum]|uniref:acyltransferase family protein n=1 Tax=Halalkalirubrum salinum TaxID=2563889 RepID=UPI00197AD2C7|nr:acyltransferase [Halalkalirubrum salinum]